MAGDGRPILPLFATAGYRAWSFHDAHDASSHFRRRGNWRLYFLDGYMGGKCHERHGPDGLVARGHDICGRLEAWEALRITWCTRGDPSGGSPMSRIIVGVILTVLSWNVSAVERQPLALVCHVTPANASVMTNPIQITISLNWSRRGIVVLQGRPPLPLIENETPSFVGSVSIDGERPRVVFFQELNAYLTGISFDGYNPETYRINFWSAPLGVDRWGS